MLAEATNITFTLPGWFCGVLSLGVVGVVFFAGYQWKAVKEVCAEFPKIRRALDLISNLLLSHDWIKSPVYVSAQSPIALTDAGRTMLKDSRFEEFFSANKKMFFDKIAAENPKTESEVQDAAKNAMLYLDMKTTPKIDIVESYSYRVGRPIADILFAYSIELRDRYLKEKFSKPTQ